MALCWINITPTFQGKIRHMPHLAALAALSFTLHTWEGLKVNHAWPDRSGPEPHPVCDLVQLNCCLRGWALPFGGAIVKQPNDHNDKHSDDSPSETEGPYRHVHVAAGLSVALRHSLIACCSARLRGFTRLRNGLGCKLLPAMQSFDGLLHQNAGCGSHSQTEQQDTVFT